MIEIRILKTYCVYARGAYRPVSKAQIRALRLAAIEGGLDNHRRRWAPLSRSQGLGPNDAIAKPYEQGCTVFTLESRGLLAPDPDVSRGDYPHNRPRPRFITELGKKLLARIDAERPRRTEAV